MRGKTRAVLVALLAVFGLAGLGGCIVVHDDDGYHHRHHWDHDRGHRGGRH